MAQARRALVALGGNQPYEGLDPAQILQAAMAEIVREGFEIKEKSFLYATPCFPVGAGPDYVNSAVQISLDRDENAAHFLDVLHRIEANFGRKREMRWGQRSLDLDLLALDDIVLPDVSTWGHWAGLSSALQAVEVPNQLILPHPRMQDRPFVLVPLADIAPQWVHPVLRRSVSQMVADLPQADRDAVRRL